MIDYISSRYGTGGSGVSKMEKLKDIDFTNLQDSGILVYNSVSEKWEITSYVPGEAILSDTFKNIASTGQTSLVADSSNDVLNIETNTTSTFNNLSITTDPLTDTLDISLSDTPKFEYIDLDVLSTGITPTQGRMWYNQNDDTLDIAHADGTVQQVGQEFFIPPTINNSGVIIENGSLVMFTGVQSDKFTIAKAVSDGSISSNKMLGVATTDIPIDSTTGKIVTNGMVRGLDTSLWVVGTVLYHNPLVAGGWTSTKPESPNIKTPIGVVIKSNATDGWIYVRMNLGSKLGEYDSDIQLSTPNANDVIYYNSVNSRWENSQLKTISNNNLIGSTNIEAELETGFSTPQTVIENYDPVTRTVTLSGVGTLYYKGETILDVSGGHTSIAHPDTVGGWFYSYGESGFKWTAAPWQFGEDAMVAYGYYGSVDTFGIRECHGLMSWESHREFHEQIGTYRRSGGDVVITTLSAVTADKQPTIAQTTIADEDLPTTLPALSVKGDYTHFYLTGNETITFSKGNTHIAPIDGTSGRLQYNQDNNGTWQLTTIDLNNNFHVVYLVAIPVTSDSTSQDYRYVFFQGQTQYSSLAEARSATFSELNVSNFALLSPEWAILEKFILRSSNTSNGWSVEETLRITTTRSNTLIASAGITSHTLLDDRDALDQHPISSIIGLNDALASKQETLVSGTNIKTINGESLLGSTNIVIEGNSYTAGTGLTLTGTEFTLTPITSGDLTIGSVRYNGTTKTAGQFDGGTTNPSNTIRLNYDGNLYATGFYGDGSNLTGITSGATITNDTTTDITQYLGMSRATTGAWTEAYTASTKLYFNPSTGTLSSTEFNSLSDINYKINVTKIENASNTINKLEGVEFDWKDNGQKSSGVIAQQLEQILPHLVSENDQGIKSVNYNGLVGYLIESNKEMANRINKLETLIDKMLASM